jgi:predicted secreted acid phosphatase
MKRTCIILAVVLLCCGCAGITTERINLNSVAWMQTSEEYRALATGAYSMARQSLDQALEDATWTALPAQVPASSEETAILGGLPPAVILDIDETVLGTLPYQAWLVRNRKPFTLASWHAWVSEASAEAVPGALEFVRYAMDKGVTVFYLSNRAFRGPLDRNGNGTIDQGEEQLELKPYTIANLLRLGFLPQDNLSNEDSVLLRGETAEDGRVLDGWDSSDKFARRNSLSSGYRVVLIMGDSLNDFLGERELLAGRGEAGPDAPGSYTARWGRSWIMLPNPIYGSWEKRLYDSMHPLPGKQKTRIKLDSLDTWQ